MRIIVTGVNGQLGYDVVKELQNRQYDDVLGIDIDDLDITNRELVQTFMDSNKPDVLIHCAAYTAVDNAEDNEDVCMRVNVEGTKNLVDAARKHDAKFVYISTDYVFDGKKKDMYHVIDNPHPTSVYGLSKYKGELETIQYDKHFIIRISWVFGKNGNNFVKTMLRLGKDRDILTIVGDQIGSPTYTLDLSRLIVDMIETNHYGLYHASNEGECSWFDFAQEIFRLTRNPIEIKAITTDQYPTKAKRPQNSMLDKSSLDNSGFKRLPHWKDALKRYLGEIGEV